MATTAEKKKKREFGSIRQKSENCWEGKYSIKSEPKYITAPTYEEVDLQLAQIQLDIRAGKYKESSKMKFCDWYHMWISDYFTARPATIGTYLDQFDNHVMPHPISRKPLCELSAADFIKFFKEKSVSGRLDGKPGGLSQKTLRNLRNYMNGALQQAIVNKLLDTNPLSGVKVSISSQSKKRVFSTSEQMKFEGVVDSRSAYDISLLGLIIALYTGIRLGELCGLRWPDVNLDHQPAYIDVSKTLNRVKQFELREHPEYEILMCNPGQATCVVLGPVKTTKGERRIYLPEPVELALLKLRAWQDELSESIGADFNPWQFVMICPCSYNYFEPRTYMDKFYDVVARAKILKANFHCLRHTFATRAVEQGIDIATLSEILGHADKSTTMNMYVHSLDDTKKLAATQFTDMNAQMRNQRVNQKPVKDRLKELTAKKEQGINTYEPEQEQVKPDATIKSSKIINLFSAR